MDSKEKCQNCLDSGGDRKQMLCFIAIKFDTLGIGYNWGASQSHKFDLISLLFKSD